MPIAIPIELADRDEVLALADALHDHAHRLLAEAETGDRLPPVERAHLANAADRFLDLAIFIAGHVARVPGPPPSNVVDLRARSTHVRDHAKAAAHAQEADR